MIALLCIRSFTAPPGKVADILVDPATSEKKIADILIDNLKEALKAVELSIALTFTCVVFMLMHGVQGDFVRRISAERTQAVQSSNAADSRMDDRQVSEKLETTIPVFGFRADLLTASIAALALYWVFCLRAAFRCRRAKLIAYQLGKIDPQIVAAVLLLSSLATAGKSAKVLSCVVLGGLGFAAYLVMYTPMKPATDLLLSAGFVMLIPAGVLGWSIWGVPSSNLRP